MKKLKINKAYFATYFSIAVIICLMLIFTVMEKSFINASNINNLLSDTAPLMIMAAGMTPVILLGSIDLSIGAMCSVSNVLVVSLIMKFKDTIYADWFIMLVTFLTTLLFSVVGGIILGSIHAKLKVPSFIASLAFMSIWNSAALLISSSPISIPKKLWGTIEWYKISIGPLGYPLIIAFLIMIGYYVILTRTPLGRGIYAIGANERAARMSGISVDRIKIAVFAVNGFCAALGAIFLMAKAKSCAPTVGDSFTLMVISAVVLGGTALIGGSGNILNTIMGVFIVSIIKNGMNIVSINVYWQKIVFGLVVLIAIAINTDRSSRSFIVK